MVMVMVVVMVVLVTRLVMVVVVVTRLVCRTGRFVTTCPSRRIKLMVGCYRSTFYDTYNMRICLFVYFPLY